MTYTKPSVVELGSAVEAILGSTVKPPSNQLDADNIHVNATSTAYEADE